MSINPEALAPAYDDKPVVYDTKPKAYDSEHGVAASDDYDVQAGEGHNLRRDLQSRHMQMIAIGGAIGAGYFVGSGEALHNGGPGSLVLSFIIVGTMLMCVMQSLAELAVMYPVRGAFFTYAVRFIDPAVGFATGWDYAISWLIILPFEITAAGITLDFWQGARDVNIGVWVTVFLVALCTVQVFGVRGYGEVEFILSIIKVIACVGFVILGVIIDCGGTGPQGYIGARYWYSPGAFNNGFKGFCSNFANAAFAYAGTELVGLAAAEAANPLRSLPTAARQVFFRIAFFYVIGLFIVGLIVPYTNDDLLGASGDAASPFVIAIKSAQIKGLPSVMNAVITVSVLSVANSATFGSTRTIQALAEIGMAPKFFSYIDKHGRPIYCVLLQISFGFLAFINEATSTGGTIFSWLLALSGLIQFFVWGAICMSHIRFRAAWKYNGHTLDQIPYKSPYGLYGAWYGFFMNCVCIVAVFYASLYAPDGSPPTAYNFFNEFLAGPIVLAFYLFWKLYSRSWRMLIPLSEIDVHTGLNGSLDVLQQQAKELEGDKTWKNLPMRMVRALF